MNDTIFTASYPIHIGPDALQALAREVAAGGYTQVIVLTDHNTSRDCLPHLEKVLSYDLHHSIAPGETHKSIATCESFWQVMTALGVDRKALVINLGGGLVGDLGGFSAACYKRGIAFIQVPTTLLAQVDASVGGKTGVNFDHFKNQIGAFANPQAVIVCPTFLGTLSPRELRSGYGEVLKHCLIADAPEWLRLKQLPGLPENLTSTIARSIQIKADIVAQDPREAGIRKALNFGHTIGHALESWHLDRPGALLHGEAVAAGMVCESYLSQQKGSLTPDALAEIAATILRLYGRVAIPQAACETIAQLALQDKKNRGHRILCTTLADIGQFQLDTEISQSDVIDSLRYYSTVSYA